MIRSAVLARVAALGLALTASLVAPRLDAWRLIGNARLLRPLRDHLFHSTVPIVACVAGALAVAAGVSLGRRASQRLRVFLPLGTLIPAAVALAQARSSVRASAALFCDGTGGLGETVIGLATAIQLPLETIADGVLRSATLLLALALFAMPPRTAPSQGWTRSMALSTGAAVLVVLGARFVHRTGISVLDLLPPFTVAIFLASMIVRSSEDHRSHRSIALAAVAALVLFDVGMVASSTSEVLRIFMATGLSRADREALLQAAIARERLRSLLLPVDLTVVGGALLLALRRARATGKEPVSGERASELVPTAMAVCMVALIAGTAFRWSGGARRLSMVDQAVARFSADRAPPAGDPGAPFCLPANLSDEALSIDRAGALRLAPRIGRPHDAHGDGGATSPPRLLIVSDELSLGRVTDALSPRIAAGEGRYRWTFATVPKPKPELGAYGSLHLLRQLALSTVDFEPNAHVVTEPAPETEGHDRWIGMLVTQDVPPGDPPDGSGGSESTARVVPLLRSSTGYHVDGDDSTWGDVRASSCADCGAGLDSVLVFFSRGAPAVDVARFVKTLASDEEQRSAFRRIRIAGPRETIEPSLSDGVAHFFARRRAACVEAARRANDESPKTRLSFEEILLSNPKISRDELEFVVGALQMAQHRSLTEIRGITDCAVTGGSHCDARKDEYAVRYRFGGVAVSKRSGVVRGTWEAHPEGKATWIRMGETQVMGAFLADPRAESMPANPVDLVRRVVRRSFAQIRQCYEPALEKNPDLQGSVTVRFTIAKDGSVQNATGTAREMADPAVTGCIIRSFRALSFPKPARGAVRVVSPIIVSR